MSFEKTTCEKCGIATEKVAEFLKIAPRYGVHSLLLLKGGKLAVEEYITPYAADKPQILHSVSKTFTCLAACFAVAEGKLSFDDNISKFFPEYKIHPTQNGVKVRHLLSMTWGHNHDTNDFFTGDDWVKNCLAHPIEYKPGERFIYDTAATYMVSAIISKIFGENVNSYLTERLFKPLGIEKHDWSCCPAGISHGGFGLAITPESLAKICQLLLDGGKWEGKQLIPREIIAEMTKTHIIGGGSTEEEPPAFNCGYAFCLWTDENEHIYRAMGAFGQFGMVVPDSDAVIVVTGGIQRDYLLYGAVTGYLVPAVRGIGGEAPLPTGLMLPTPDGDTEENHTFDGTYEIGPNLLYCQQVKLSYIYFNDFEIEMLEINGFDLTFVSRKYGRYKMKVGQGKWEQNYKTSVCGAWANNKTLVLRIAFDETPYVDTVTIGFTESGFTAEGKRNTAFTDENYKVLGNKK